MAMTDCINWHKSIRDTGYGQTFFRGKVMRAHRVAWIKANGEIPEGMVVDHMCRNRSCVNVEHLRVVTQRENIISGLHNIDNRTHCNQGHPFEGNIMVRANGNRECAECNRVRSRMNYAKKKAGV
jgi:hypothetical protein